MKNEKEKNCGSIYFPALIWGRVLTLGVIPFLGGEGMNATEILVSVYISVLLSHLILCFDYILNEVPERHEKREKALLYVADFMLRLL